MHNVRTNSKISCSSVPGCEPKFKPSSNQCWLSREGEFKNKVFFLSVPCQGTKIRCAIFRQSAQVVWRTWAAPDLYTLINRATWAQKALWGPWLHGCVLEQSRKQTWVKLQAREQGSSNCDDLNYLIFFTLLIPTILCDVSSPNECTTQTKQAFRVHRWTPVSLRQWFRFFSLCLVPSYMTLQEKSEWETKSGERPLPSHACLHSSVPAASLQSEQTRTPVSGKAAVVIMRRAERRHKGHLVSKCGSTTTLQQDLLGSHWKRPSPDWNIAQGYRTGLTRVRSWVQFLAWEGMKESIRLPFQKT